MIDSVLLMTEDFALDPGHNLVRTTKTSADGQVLKEELNGGGAGLTCKIRYSPLIGGYGLSVQSSLPKLIHGTSLFEVQEQDKERCIEAIGRGLQEIGVRVGNPGGFQLSRLDFCKNLHVNGDITDYMIALSKLDLPKRESRDIKKETLIWQNGAQELTWYNKRSEVMQDKKHTEPQYRELARLSPNNILRQESRMKRHRVVVQELGEDLTFGEIFDRERSQTKLLKDFDSLTCFVSAREYSVGDMKEHLAELAKTQSFPLQYLLRVLGAEVFIGGVHAYDWDKIEETLASVLSKKSVSRNLRALQAIMPLTHKEVDLLGELRTKLAA